MTSLTKEEAEIGHIDHSELLEDSEVDQSAIGGRDISDLPPNYYRSWRFAGSTIAFAIGAAAAIAIQPMLAGAIQIINADIGPSPDSVWIVLSYTLCQGTSFPILGRFSDLYGRRWLFVCTFALAWVGAIVASRAKSVNVLIGAIAMLGFGSGAAILGTGIPAELVPNNKRFLMFGAIVSGLGPWIAISPGLGRTLCVSTGQGWRWIFYLSAILFFITDVLVFLCYFPPEFKRLHKSETKTYIIKHFDYVGMIAYCGGTALIILGLSWGGQRYPWKSAAVITTLVLGGVLLVALYLWGKFKPSLDRAKSRSNRPLEKLYNPSHPCFDLRILTNWNWLMLTISSCVGSMIFFALNIVWVEQLAILFRLSPSKSGWGACTMTGGTVLGWAVSAVVLTVWPKVSIKYQLIASTIVITTFIGAEASADGSNLASGIIFSLLGGFGIGYLETICIAAAPLHLNAKNLGVASGLQFSLRTVLSGIASAIFVTILNNQVKSNVPSRIISAAVKSGLSESSAIDLAQALMLGKTDAVESIPGITPSIIAAAGKAARKGYFKSFQVVYYVSIAFGALAIFSACLFKDELLAKHLTPEIARRMRHAEGTKAGTEKKTQGGLDPSSVPENDP